MKDALIGRTASHWASLYDEHQAAQRELARANSALKAKAKALEIAHAELLAAVVNNASVMAIEHPITIRTWQDHAVIVDVKSNIVQVALAVDRQ